MKLKRINKIKIVDSYNSAESQFMIPELDISNLIQLNGKQDLEFVFLIIKNLVNPKLNTDMDLLQNFILTYHHFVTNEALIDIIIQINLDYSNQIVTFKLLNILKKVLNLNTTFLTKELKETIKEFLKNIELKDKQVIEPIFSLLQSKHDSSLIYKNYQKFYIPFECIHIKLFSEELTLIDDYYFKQINHYELFNCLKSTQCGPNLMILINNFYSLYYYYDQIINANSNNLELLMMIADELLKLNNFNSLCCTLIILKKYVSKLKTKALKNRAKTLLKIINEKNNYEYYKLLLKQNSLPCIPYIGLMIKDLILSQLEGNDKFQLFKFYRQFYFYKSNSYLNLVPNQSYRNMIFSCIYKSDHFK